MLRSVTRTRFCAGWSRGLRSTISQLIAMADTDEVVRSRLLRAIRDVS
jgi:hypothetical protein